MGNQFSTIVKNREINGTEEIRLVSPTPGLCLAVLLSPCEQALLLC